MKKIFSLILSVSMLFATTSVFAVDYPDVEAGTASNTAITALTNLEIVDGFEDGLFRPDENVTRAQMAKMICMALGYDNIVSGEVPFTDMDASHWASGYVSTAVGLGIIDGFEDNTFRPEENVTYAQAVKMLVAAIGYGTYAEINGGWTAGYMSYGSSLEIINGITDVTNDTPLTREQCTVLIYNTLKAPLCKVTGYEPGYNGEYVPKYEVMDGESGRAWKSALTEYHNAYDVMGRVVSVDKNKDTVKYNIEKSDCKVDTTTPVVEINGTEAGNMLYEYSEAIIQKNEDTGKYTMISIKPYGNTESVLFAAADTAVDTTSSKVLVSQDGTSKTKDYKLSATPVVYVNGEIVSVTIDSALFTTYKDYGMVTLIDATNIASTSADGYYDYIMIDNYTSGQVSDVKIKDNDVTIRYDNNRIEWSLEDDDVIVNIYKNGKEISYEDINEDDVILVKNDSLKNWYEILVSDEIIVGKATSKKDDQVTINGDRYTAINCANNVDLNSVYTFYLDAFGNIYSVEEDYSVKNIGFVISRYNDASGDVSKVKLMTATGDIVTYEMKEYTSNTVFKPANQNDIANRVVEYTLTKDGKVRLLTPLSDYTINGEYKESTSKLGSYTINENTTIFELNSDGDVTIVNIDDLAEDELYAGAAYERNTNGVYSVVVLTNGTTTLRDSADLAIVTASGEIVNIDGTQCQVLTVAKNGEEDIEVLYEDYNRSIPEGSLIQYQVGTEGYVETAKLKVVNEDFGFDWTAAYGSVYDMHNPTGTNVDYYIGVVYRATNSVIEIFTDDSVNNVEAFTLAGANVYTYNADAAIDEGISVSLGGITQRTSIFKDCFGTDLTMTNIVWNDVVTNDVEPAIAIIRTIDDDTIDVIFYTK